ncbi:MAG TPA: LamG domain-containing protein [Polyangia bacterium]
MLLGALVLGVACGPSGSRAFLDVDAQPGVGGTMVIQPMGGAPGAGGADARGGSAGNVGGAGGSKDAGGEDTQSRGGNGGTAGAGGTGGIDAGGTTGGTGGGGRGGAGGTVAGGSGGSGGSDGALPDTVPQSPLAVGLVGRWKLDDLGGASVVDSTGNDNAGYLAGSPTWTTPGFPAAKYPNPAGIHFDGVDDHVDVGTRGLPALNTPHSVAFWMRYGTLGTTYQVAVGLGDGGTGRLKIGLRASAIAVWRSGTAIVSITAPAPGWHHVVYTFDGTTQSLYVDGVMGTPSTQPPDVGAVMSARLGTQQSGTERFTGDLDEVRIYNRALNANEVSSLFAGME